MELLGANFFAPKRAGTAVTFFVDDDELARLSALPAGQAAESLVRAITELFGDLTAKGAYVDALKATRAWERSGSKGYVRCLPFLALAVLAGTKMAEDGVIRKTNYYKRYRALIGMAGGGQPSGYAYMPELWGAYTRWLDDTREGELGVSTATEHPTYTYIGYALSQALFRASDRHELTYFLDSLGAPVTAGISGVRLVLLLRTWAAWRGRFSAGARLLINDPGYAPQLELLIRDVARSWDGTVLDEFGRRESRILLHWNFEDGEPLTTLAERPEGFPEEVIIGPGANQAVLTALSGTRFYREAPVAVDSDLLQYGRRIRSGRYSFRLPGQGIHLLSENGEVPGWSSTRRFSWSRPHLVITDTATAQSLRPLLDQGAETGWTGPRPNAALPEGWVAFRRVMPRAEAAEAWAGSALGQLLPMESPQASLANGLRLARARVYLLGGEPDLVCPADMYVIDEVRHSAVPGSVVSLRGQGLGPGRHIVAVGAQRLRFALARGFAALPSAAETPLELQISRDAAIAGAAAPADWARNRFRQLLKRKHQYIAIGAKPGQVANLSRELPVGRTSGLLYPPFDEAELPFEPVWFIVTDQKRGRSVKLVTPRLPEPAAASGGTAQKVWASFFVAPLAGAPDLWDQYREAARQLVKGDGAG